MRADLEASGRLAKVATGKSRCAVRQDRPQSDFEAVCI